jgi:hypothetical protein
VDEIDRLMERLDEEYLADVTGPQRWQLHHLLNKLAAGAVLTQAYDGMCGG